MSGRRTKGSAGGQWICGGGSRGSAGARIPAHRSSAARVCSRAVASDEQTLLWRRRAVGVGVALEVHELEAGVQQQPRLIKASDEQTLLWSACRWCWRCWRCAGARARGVRRERAVLTGARVCSGGYEVTSSVAGGDFPVGLAMRWLFLQNGGTNVSEAIIY